MNTLFGFLGLEAPIHWVILLVIGVLLFGKRLPEVGRSLGKGLIEFKKGLKGLEDDIEGGGSAPTGAA
jgi:sec-independent protein translocase protein TatA